MKPIQFLNNNCFCVCAIYILHTAFMYVSMIWKEQVYNVKYDTAESLSSKHQALLMFYLFLWYLLCRIIYFANKYRATGPGIQIECDHCCVEVCVCSRDDRIVDFHYPILSCFSKTVSVSDPYPAMVEIMLSVSENYPKVYCVAQHTFSWSVYFVLLFCLVRQNNC